MIAGDSTEYEYISEEIAKLDLPPVVLTCEIGLRRGLGSQTIMDSVIAKGPEHYRHLAVDPYGNLNYQHYDDRPPYTADYTVNMKTETLFDLVWKQDEISPFNKAFPIIKENTELLKTFKSLVYRDMLDPLKQHVIPKGNVMIPNLELLVPYVQKNKNKLQQTFGDQYVTNLEKVLTALKPALTDVSPQQARQPTDLLTTFARSVVGVFTRPGRILTFINPEQDPLGSGYHIAQSKIAIGSGGFFGKGYFKGSQSHLEFIPEMHTDFVFSIYAEEFGFLGSLILILIYSYVLCYGVLSSYKAKSTFSKLIIAGLTINIFLYFIVNISMVIGVIPVVGVPLPLVSYGGSAMLVTMISFGLIMNLNSHKDNLH